MAEISKLETDVNVSRISDLASQFQLSEFESTEIFAKLGAENLNFMLFNSPHGIFRTEHMRKKYFKDTFNFIEPVQIPIDIEKSRYLYYVPVLQTLKSVFHETIDPIVPHRKIDGFMSDYKDGLRFTNNSFYQRENTIHLLIYQDGFGTVNPLGDAKKRHKIIGVYMTIGNMHPSLRASSDNSFLVLLCLEEDLKLYGVDNIFNVLINDLKSLETDGLRMNCKGKDVVFYGSVFALLGDNLGNFDVICFMLY